ncbi:dipeptidyl aminopeptidase/acylaminoacyl peptidase [Planomicrobium stackebrandtii]|uniref:Dipeptidyl aminopeptidase/acylaminoacyl peptidase n=1 Tax=Planomicrobium stackebrandtii TaxID=253160 RepID=A0ABU0GTP8_9BACL|nr:S9 family peptidase [Planomicrobium stackebrandtii]MDQ0428735.1 dipeptidyl aminopeptidase/acylaminoacyl peptidase [Planomicrobium stackebrandtii]
MSDISTHDLFAYLNVTGASQPEVIPNQRTFTFLSKKTGLPQVWKWNGNSNDVEQVTDLEDRILLVSHSPSGKKTIVGMDHKGNEKQQFYVMDSDGSNIEALVVSPDHFHHFGGWSPDETKIAFSSNRRHPGYFDVFIVDLDEKKEQAIYETEANCNPVCWTKDGQSLILSIPDTNIDQSYYVLNIETKEKMEIGSEDVLGRHHSIQLTKDGKGGLIVSDVGRDTLSIRQFSFESLYELDEIHSVKDWDIEEIELSPNNSQLAFTINEGGISRLGIYNLHNQTQKMIEKIPSGVFESLSWLAEDELVLGLKSPVYPGDIWKVSVDTGQSERLTHVGEDKTVEHLWLEPELCSFSSFDGLRVPYFLYGKQEYSQPVVIYVHGGPESQIRAEFNPVIQFLAANGFAVAAPNVRGSMGYGREYVQLDDVRKRMDSVADLKELAEDLVSSHGADRAKIGIMGRSYGGFMVLAALTSYPAVWAAGVDIVGISHFKSFLENTGSWRRAMREYEYGSLKDDGDFFEEIAPLNHTANIQAPLLVFHGRNDTRVPVSEAEQLTADLKNQDKHVELIIFEDEGHQTEKMENHIHMNTMIVEFMDKFLGGKRQD